MTTKPWKRIEPTVVSKIGYRTVVVKHFEQPNGRIIDWTVLNEDGWAAALSIALTPDNKVIVARQFRPGPETIFDDLPGGIVDANETPEECAVRELAEETGFRPGSVEPLGRFSYDANVNGTRHYFFMTNCTPSGSGQQLDADEFIEVRLIHIEEFLQNAKDGRMGDVGAVLKAYDRLQKIATADKRRQTV